MSCESYRHDLQVWLYRWPDDIHNDSATLYCLRGDAYVEMNMSWRTAQRLAHPQFWTAYERLITEQLDKYVDEAHCKESGGHEYVDDRCMKCYAWNLEETG